jgi:hypothetical protein
VLHKLEAAMADKKGSSLAENEKLHVLFNGKIGARSEHLKGWLFV